MKDFLAISDLSSKQVQGLLDLAIELKKEYFKKGNKKIFKGKVLGMIFQKPSLRTARFVRYGDASMRRRRLVSFSERDRTRSARVDCGCSPRAFRICGHA